MIIKKITVNNMGPFLSEWVVMLQEGPTVFVGDYENASERSNRAGKSWVAVDAPLYALHGWFRGSKVDELPHRLALGKDDSFVELEVESSLGVVWTIRRGRTAGGDPIRELNGSAIKEQDLKRVVEEEIVGLTLEEHLLTTAFVQGEMHAFMKMGAADKRRVVSPWFKTDRWIPRHDLAKRRLGRSRAKLAAISDMEARYRDQVFRRLEVDTELSTLEAVRAEEASTVDRLRADYAERKRLLQHVDNDLRELSKLTKERDELAETIAAHRGRLARELQTAERDVDRARHKVVEARSRKQQIASIEQRAAKIAELRGVVGETSAELRAASSSLVSVAKARKELLAKYNEHKESRTGICPILREACDRVEQDPAIITEIRREGLRATRETARLQGEIEALDWKLSHSRSDLAMAEEDGVELERLRSMPTHAEAERDYGAAQRELQRVERESEQLRLSKTTAQREHRRILSRIEDLKKVTEDTSDRDKLDEIRRSVGAATIALAETDLKLAAIRATSAECARAQEKLDTLAEDRLTFQTEIENLAWCVYAFGSAGIPSREIENAFGLAEVGMNEVLSDLDTPLRVRFSPTRELQEWEPACLACGELFKKGERTHVCPECGTDRRKKRRDELRLEVIDGENVSTFDLDSGGGKILLSLGVRLGLATLPSSSRAVRCESLILDEPDGALDEPARRALYALLNERLSRLGIRQILLITHTDAKAQFGSSVTVHRWEDEDRSGVWND